MHFVKSSKPELECQKRKVHYFLTLLVVRTYHDDVLKFTIESKSVLLNKLLTKDHDVLQTAPSISIENWQFSESKILIKMAEASDVSCSRSHIPAKTQYICSFIFQRTHLYQLVLALNSYRLGEEFNLVHSVNLLKCCRKTKNNLHFPIKKFSYSS